MSMVVESEGNLEENGRYSVPKVLPPGGIVLYHLSGSFRRNLMVVPVRYDVPSAFARLSSATTK